MVCFCSGILDQSQLRGGTTPRFSSFLQPPLSFIVKLPLYFLWPCNSSLLVLIFMVKSACAQRCRRQERALETGPEADARKDRERMLARERMRR